MIRLINFLFIIFPCIAIAQTSWKENLSKDVCECFETVNKDESSLLDCFSKNISKYEKELASLINKNSELSEYEQGKILGRKTFFEMQQDLISGCEVYYLYFEKAREDGLDILRENNYTKKIDSLTSKIQEENKPDLILERGNIYFANKDLNNTESDYLECLEINPNHIQSIFFLGWVNEKRGNYKKAIELYEKVLNQTGQQEIILFIELARKKLTNN